MTARSATSVVTLIRFASAPSTFAHSEWACSSAFQAEASERASRRTCDATLAQAARPQAIVPLPAIPGRSYVSNCATRRVCITTSVGVAVRSWRRGGSNGRSEWWSSGTPATSRPGSTRSVPSSYSRPDPTFPDAGIYQGEALREWMRDWVRTWKDNRFELLDYTEIGDASLPGRAGTSRLRSPARVCPSATSQSSSGDGPDPTAPGCPHSSARGGAGEGEERLADSPVNRCMLFKARLGCLKKPT